MPRRIRINQPPATNDTSLNVWMREVTEQLNLLPAMSIISTSDGPNSAFSGNSGDWAIDIGSSNSTFWAKETDNDSMTGWSEFSFL